MESSPPIKTNRHIIEFLTYYLSLKEPRYAVLLNGPWGVGKTHLIKRFLLAHFTEPYDYVYISLYGLKDAQEIDMALLRSMYPWTGTKTTKIVSRIASAACQFLDFEPKLKVTDVLNRPKAQVYVFDDLERCEMPLNMSLGYINELVEHDGARVVILAHTNEIDDQEAFTKRKEKLIGKTLEVQSSYDEAFQYFLTLMEEQSTWPLIAKNGEAIAAVYQQSGLENLRILQQTMWDFERVLNCWTDVHLNHDDALQSAIKLFFAISFEIRSGRLNSAALTGRDNPWARYLDKEAKPTPFELASGRYVGTNLYDPILTDQILIDVITKGLVDQSSIQTSLNQSEYFITIADEPAWRTVWHFFERPDEIVLPAFVTLEKKFFNREYEVIGEILHVMGLRLQMSDTGVLAKSRDEVVAEAKAYIDDLYTQKRLEQLPANLSGEDFRFGGHEGLAIQQNDTSDYRAILDYLRNKRKQVTEDTYPHIAQQILLEMENDPELFFRRVCTTNTADSLYAKVPVLASIDPGLFANNLAKLNPKGQRNIFLALKARYEHGSLNEILAVEKPWLKAVRDNLIAIIESAPVLGRYRLQKFVESSVSSILED